MKTSDLPANTSLYPLAGASINVKSEFGYQFLDNVSNVVPIVVAVLEKENAVSDFRTLIGATNPDEAAEGTIRKHYAKSMGENAVHGSDSDENALIESSFHFAGVDLY